MGGKAGGAPVSALGFAPKEDGKTETEPGPRSRALPLRRLAGERNDAADHGAKAERCRGGSKRGMQAGIAQGQEAPWRHYCHCR